MSATDKQREAYRRHDQAQRAAWARLSPVERLRWLQQAKEFVLRYRGAAGKTGAGGGDRR